MTLQKMKFYIIDFFSKWDKIIFQKWNKSNSEWKSSQTTVMKLFCKKKLTVNNPLLFLKKIPTVDIRLGSKYPSAIDIPSKKCCIIFCFRTFKSPTSFPQCTTFLVIICWNCGIWNLYPKGTITGRVLNYATKHSSYETVLAQYSISIPP